MINYVIKSGIVAIGLTIVTLGSALAIIKTKQYLARKEYKAVVKEKMRVLAQLQEEDEDSEVSEEEASIVSVPNLPPQTPLPVEIFEQNYLEVKQ